MTIERIQMPPIGTNSYLVVSEAGGCAVIDPAADAARILERCARLGAAVRLILLTHGHFDHIGAVAELKRTTGAPVLISAADAPMLTDPDRSLAASFGMEQQTVRPDRLLQEGDALELDELTFTVLETPGHTPGSLCFQCGDMLFSGDTLFCGSIGRTDFPGGSKTDMQRSLRRLAGLEGDLRVLPGHEAETTLEHERRRNPYLR